MNATFNIFPSIPLLPVNGMQAKTDLVLTEVRHETGQEAANVFRISSGN
jgi:hypothetical protein